MAPVLLGIGQCGLLPGDGIGIPQALLLAALEKLLSSLLVDLLFLQPEIPAFRRALGPCHLLFAHLHLELLDALPLLGLFAFTRLPHELLGLLLLADVDGGTGRSPFLLFP